MNRMRPEKPEFIPAAQGDRRSGLLFRLPDREEALKDDKEAQENREHYLVPPGRQRSVAPDERFYCSLDEHSEERADDGADSAGEQRSADDRRSDRLHLEAARLLHEAGGGIQTKYESGKRRQKAVQHIGAKLGSPDVYSHEQGGLFISADRKQGSSEPGVLADVPNREQGYYRDGSEKHLSSVRRDDE